MDWPTYRKFTERELKGKRVRALCNLYNGHLMIAKGTILTITGKHIGFSLSSESCVACGVVAKVTRVAPYEVEFLE